MTLSHYIQWHFLITFAGSCPSHSMALSHFIQWCFLITFIAILLNGIFPITFTETFIIYILNWTQRIQAANICLDFCSSNFSNSESFSCYFHWHFSITIIEIFPPHSMTLSKSYLLNSLKHSFCIHLYFLIHLMALSQFTDNF